MHRTLMSLDWMTCTIVRHTGGMPYAPGNDHTPCGGANNNVSPALHTSVYFCAVLLAVLHCKL